MAKDEHMAKDEQMAKDKHMDGKREICKVSSYLLND